MGGWVVCAWVVGLLVEDGAGTRNPRLQLSGVGVGTASLTLVRVRYPLPPANPGAPFGPLARASLRSPSLARRNGPVVVNGSKHALVYNWNGDNKGPSGASAYQKSFAGVAATFPNAHVYASTFVQRLRHRVALFFIFCFPPALLASNAAVIVHQYVLRVVPPGVDRCASGGIVSNLGLQDNFTQHLLPLLHTSALPVITKEMGDTWVYGCPSDPQKVARMRVINRAWRDEAARWPGGSLLAAGNTLASDPVFSTWA